MLRERENLILIRSTAVIGSRGHKHTHTRTPTHFRHTYTAWNGRCNKSEMQQTRTTNRARKGNPKRERKNEKVEPS